MTAGVERLRRAGAILACTLLASACVATSETVADSIAFNDNETVDEASDQSSETTTSIPSSEPVVSSTVPAERQPLEIIVAPSLADRDISDLIRGVSGDVNATYGDEAGITLRSWGGTASTRYNYQLGNAWNGGAEWEFRNTDFGVSGDRARRWLGSTKASDEASRLAVPTLGWVAKDSDYDNCSYPDGEGGCRLPRQTGCAYSDELPADPTTTSVRSTAPEVAAWIADLVSEGLTPDIIALDNQPELWPFNHRDVHPECATFEEILERHIEYTSAIREVTDAGQFSGPVTCCWFSYWREDPGPADGTVDEFIPWYLRNVREHDEATGSRSLHFLDVHYHPQQDDVRTDVDDDWTSELRMRSTRALWDRSYVDESWLDRPIAFIPRMRDYIDEHYPGTGLMISEWNFGSEATMSGAIAATETLALFGREGVDAASYWPQPEYRSAAYFGFKLHGNYDDQGGAFSGRSVPLVELNPNEISAFAAVDDDGTVRVLLINKTTYLNDAVRLQIEDVDESSSALAFGYSDADLTKIVQSEITMSDGNLEVPVPPMSITLVEVSAS